MEKKKYITPKFNIVRIEGESLMDDFNFGFGSQPEGTTEVKRHIPVIIDDDEEYEELEEATAIW